MTLAELIAGARLAASDEVPERPLWSDAEWTGFANDAENEACRRARLIIDSSTAAITRIALTPGAATFALDPRILFIRRAKLAGQPQPLGRVSFKDLDRMVMGWEDETGTPRGYIPDMEDGAFRPYPVPSENGTVSLTVIRLPLLPMIEAEDAPEIRPHLHPSLMHWMLFRAYSKQDSQTADPKKAAESLALFEQEFGRKSTAADEAWIEREHGYTDEEGVY